MTRDEELESLRNKLSASQRAGRGMKDRIKAIEARISEIESDAENRPTA
jgi:hypothetical protein